jgi:hypothetical protein
MLKRDRWSRLLVTLAGGTVSLFSLIGCITTTLPVVIGPVPSLPGGTPVTVKPAATLPTPFTPTPPTNPIIVEVRSSAPVCVSGRAVITFTLSVTGGVPPYEYVPYPSFAYSYNPVTGALLTVEVHSADLQHWYGDIELKPYPDCP